MGNLEAIESGSEQVKPAHMYMHDNYDDVEKRIEFSNEQHGPTKK